jgi:hypothetical protein
MALWKLVLSFSYNLVCAWRALTLKHEALPLSKYERMFGRQQFGDAEQTGYNPHMTYEMGPGPKKYYPVVQVQEVDEIEDNSVRARIKAHFQKRKSPAPLLGMLPYAITTVVGMVGLFDIVHQTFGSNRDVRLLTYALIVALVLVLASVVLLCTACCGLHVWAACYSVPIAFVVTVGALIAVLVFYSDLVIAAIEGDWLGVPSDDNKQAHVSYWVYYIAKRLPMLSW